ncbi:MAG: histidinol-phosphate transaminase [Alphaproteobacteria bacterium]|nr:histidinol-phosphate transaminase [Alphaproteobacteria bacterium]
MTPSPKPGVLDIAPYVGAPIAAGSADRIDLSSNESPLGPSPVAAAAYEEALRSISLYPDGSCSVLRRAIAESFDVDAAHIVCGNGSNEILSLIANAYVQPGEEVMFSEHAFIVYKLAALSHSGVPLAVPERARCADVDAMLSAVTPKTRLVYLANPNNPTGTMLPREEVRRLQAGLGADVLLVIDAAYAEYVGRDEYEDGLEMVERCPNVVMTRTFSKVYGLAGLRVGWAYCPEPIADVLNRVRDPFNVSLPAQRAAAAAIADQDYVRRAVDHNHYWRNWTVQALRGVGLKVGDSLGNFVLVEFPRQAGKTAQDAHRFLCERGLVLRPVANYGLPDCLRMTIGSEQANRKVAAVLGEFMSG